MISIADSARGAARRFFPPEKPPPGTSANHPPLYASEVGDSRGKKAPPCAQRSIRINKSMRAPARLGSAAQRPPDP